MKTRQFYMFLVTLLMALFFSCSEETTAPVDTEPETPNTPVPADGETGVSISSTLEWQCTDPDGDVLYYAIYFGDNATPHSNRSSHTGTTYTPYKLAYSTTYYWKVVAYDFDHNEVEGPLWSFMVEPYDVAVAPEMVVVEGGTFIMGCTAEQGYDCNGYENPAHGVTLSSFYIAKYEVTQGEYESLMGTNPSYFNGSDNLPVEKVSWYDAVKYCNALSVAEGLDPCYVIDRNNTTCDFTKNGYRLPTEAEWEYAARGGNQSQGYKYAGSDNSDEVAWYEQNSDKRTHEVGTKKPNELGLYDMSGNVWEWCWDRFNYYDSSSVSDPTGPETGLSRVLRGGGWKDFYQEWRVTSRENLSTGTFHRELGFRLVRTY